MKIEFYYWDIQCPLNYEMLQMLEDYRQYFEVKIFNVKTDFETAKQQRMFFPTLTVVEATNRYFNPLSKKFFESLLTHQLPEEKPYKIKQGKEKYTGEIKPLTPENMEVAGTCIGKNCPENSQKKLEFLKDNCPDIFGFINVEGDKLLGGIEYVPSNIVPYDIPKSEDFAFLTCAYLSSDQYDYKTAPFKALEEYLRGKYSKIIAISDEEGTFPNGDLKWFIENGFTDEGIISVEAGYCKLHLVSKII